MYEIIQSLIDHAYVTGDSMQQYIIYTCCTLILLLVVVFIDMIYRVFSHFWRGGK